MDEWIGAGDAAFQAKAKDRMKVLAERAGIIILASHQNDLIARTCNKVLELEHGRVKRFATAVDYFGAEQLAQILARDDDAKAIAPAPAKS
jgi:ABC-type polysaccharide/polyol phosphate transport system ATPase subunit